MTEPESKLSILPCFISWLSHDIELEFLQFHTTQKLTLLRARGHVHSAVELGRREQTYQNKNDLCDMKDDPNHVSSLYLSELGDDLGSGVAG